MKKAYNVVLRGHHLMVLYIFLFLGGEAKLWELMYFRYSYGEKHTQHTIKILRKIKRSNTKIKIIDTLDDICGECEQERPECKSLKKAKRDARIAEYVGLKFGRIYTSRYIIRKLKVLDKKAFLKFYSQCF
jgi:hypothetical protein